MVIRDEKESGRAAARTMLMGDSLVTTSLRPFAKPLTCPGQSFLSC